MLKEILKLFETDGNFGEKALYAHVISVLDMKHDILEDNDSTLVIYSEETDTYIAEGADADTLIGKLEKLNAERIQTASEKTALTLKDGYTFFEKCVQCYRPENSAANSVNEDFSLAVPDKSQTEWIAVTYGKSGYAEIIRAADGGRLWVLKKDSDAAGYGGIHADGSIGFLYIDPKYRGQGCGKMLLEKIAERRNGIIYSQILSDNTVSVGLHKKCGFYSSSKYVYWLYNKSFV